MSEDDLRNWKALFAASKLILYPEIVQLLPFSQGTKGTNVMSFKIYGFQ